MEISIKIPDDLLDMDKRLQRKLPGVMRRMAVEGKSFWKAEAGRKLKSSRQKYQEGIDLEIADDASFQLILEGFLPVSVEQGNKAFDMKPGFLKKALPAVGRKKFPRAVAATLAPKSVTKYRIIPLNVNRYINMQKPTVFRTVTDRSPPQSWIHPGWKGVNLSEAVIKEFEDNIIPKHIGKLLEEIL